MHSMYRYYYNGFTLNLMIATTKQEGMQTQRKIWSFSERRDDKSTYFDTYTSVAGARRLVTWRY